ncbi:hypothetical protein [Ruegeria sp. MALMAid1280]|uniref:hypothetical protein n=1 Tax=Ruegeria sp. MALMAid1280 TaxID=3411634 RepID=UPI003B9EE412
MYNPTIDVIDHSDLSEIILPDERLIWSGHPEYGQKFFQPVGAERLLHLCLLLGALAMWSTIPFIEARGNLGRVDAYVTYTVVTIVFLGISFGTAAQRQYVLQNLAYFLSNKRSIICRRGRNWRLGNRIYVISCPHSAAYPYEMIESRPYPSLQIGVLLSEDQVQPFGLGLAHPGQPVLWGRITAPIVFEYIADAKELLEAIRNCAQENTSYSENSGLNL